MDRHTDTQLHGKDPENSTPSEERSQSPHGEDRPSPFSFLKMMEASQHTPVAGSLVPRKVGGNGVGNRLYGHQDLL